MSSIDVLFFAYYALIFYFALKGLGWFFGIGMKKRWDNWVGDDSIRREWKRTKDRRYREYFIE